MLSLSLAILSVKKLEKAVHRWRFSSSVRVHGIGQTIKSPDVRACVCTSVMKISWFASQNATHFQVHANQFHMPAHVGANHLIAVYHVHVLPNERHSRTPLTSLAVWIWTEFQSESGTYLPICSGELMFPSSNDSLTAWAVDYAVSV